MFFKKKKNNKVECGEVIELTNKKEAVERNEVVKKYNKLTILSITFCLASVSLVLISLLTEHVVSVDGEELTLSSFTYKGEKYSTEDLSNCTWENKNGCKFPL